MRPGCGSLSVDPDRVDELRVRFGGGRLRSRRVELAELEDEHRGDVHARLDRRAAGRAADRGARAARCSTARRRAPDEVVAIVPPDLVDVTVEKVAINAVMAGCLPEYLPWVLTVGRGGLHRRVQHPRRARHDDAGRPGDRRQRAGHAGDRDERRGQRARPGQPGQPHDRPGAAAGRAQRRRRAARRGRPRDARQPGQAVVLLRRGRRLAVGPLAESRGATPGADAVTVFAGEGPRCIVDQLSRTPERLADVAGVVPAHAAPPQARARVRRHARRSGPSTGGSSPRPAGTGRGCSPSSTPACRSPATSSSAARAASPRACRSRSPERRCRSSAPAGCCSPTPAAAPGCSRR